MIKEEYYSEITARFGEVKRARGTFLYTEKGTRLTDMYLENGRAILGWGNGNGTTGTGAFLKIKNIINRGLTGSFETDFAKQLDKAVSDLLRAECRALVYFDTDKAEKAALSFSKRLVKYVPWVGLVAGDNIVHDFECVLITPPLPWTDNLYVLAVRNDITSLFYPERVSGAILGGLSRSIYDLIAELPCRKEKDWFIFDTYLKDYFARRGPYLFPTMSEKNYDDFVRHCLECNLAISPDYKIPSIVPYGADKGVFTLLKNNPWKA
ncbi:hypothetical protein [Treponema sp.]|uniref:hypothetical protein n=1 Tax=Treponema sp. TaxID=166 RepID=UPI00298D9D18|nr:hypothetical protein [Treponema sp.]